MVAEAQQLTQAVAQEWSKNSLKVFKRVMCNNPNFVNLKKKLLTQQQAQKAAAEAKAKENGEKKEEKSEEKETEKKSDEPEKKAEETKAPKSAKSKDKPVSPKPKTPRKRKSAVQACFFQKNQFDFYYTKTIVESFEKIKKYAHAANSPRKTRSSDFYTSMVAEAIKQSEFEAQNKTGKLSTALTYKREGSGNVGKCRSDMFRPSPFMRMCCNSTIFSAKF